MLWCSAPCQPFSGNLLKILLTLPFDKKQPDTLLVWVSVRLGNLIWKEDTDSAFMSSEGLTKDNASM